MQVCNNKLNGPVIAVFVVVLIICAIISSREVRFHTESKTIWTAIDFRQGQTIDENYEAAMNNDAVIAHSSVWEHFELQCKLIFVKVPKCGSTTNAGIARRIAANHYEEHHYAGITKKTLPKSLEIPGKCVLQCSHYPNPRDINQVTNPELKRDVTLYSFIRKPDTRVLSQYFHFQVSRYGRDMDDDSILGFLKRRYVDDFETIWLGGWFDGCRPEDDKTFEMQKICIQKILDNYQFIGLLERERESLVVLRILGGLSFSDILHVSNSKKHGTFDDLGVKIVPTIRSEAVDEYLMNKFNQEEFPDVFLYNSVEKKLENTIEWLGAERVEKDLQILEALLNEVNEYCAGRVFFPYSDEGVRQKQLSKRDCYFTDNGCGIPCLDEFVTTQRYQDVINA